MLAAVNANTNLPQFSVLRKVSSEIEESEETEDLVPESDFPEEPGEIKSVQSDKKSDEKNMEKTEKDTVKKSDKDDMQKSDKTVKKDSETVMKKTDSELKKSADASKAPAKDKSNTSKKKLCLLYTSPSPRDATLSRMPSSA